MESYSMIVFVCNISWQCNSKSYQDNWIPKKVPERWWNYILWCVTHRIFLEKLKPSDMWRSIKQNFIGKPIYCNIINFFFERNVSFYSFSKTTSNYLSFETNLASVAQTVWKWEQFKEKLSKYYMIKLSITQGLFYSSGSVRKVKFL